MSNGIYGNDEYPALQKTPFFILLNQEQNNERHV
jgi:hypothetical protein